MLIVSPWRIDSEILTSAFLPCALYDVSDDGHSSSCNILVCMCLHDTTNCGKNNALLPEPLPRGSHSPRHMSQHFVKALSALIQAMFPMVKSQKPFARGLCTWISRDDGWGTLWHFCSLPSHHPCKVLGWPGYPVPYPHPLKVSRVRCWFYALLYQLWQQLQIKCCSIFSTWSRDDCWFPQPLVLF